MKRTPPLDKAMKELGSDEMWKDITNCHEMSADVAANEETVRFLLHYSVRRLCSSS